MVSGQIRPRWQIAVFGLTTVRKTTVLRTVFHKMIARDSGYRDAGQYDDDGTNRSDFTPNVAGMPGL